MSNRFNKKTSLMETIMANAKLLSSVEIDEIDNAEELYNNMSFGGNDLFTFNSIKKKKNKKSSPSPKSPKTPKKVNNNKPKLKRKTSRPILPTTSFSFSDDDEQDKSKSDTRKSPTKRTSRSLSPNSPNKKTKTKTTTKRKTKTNVKYREKRKEKQNNSKYHLTAPSLQSIDSDDEEDEFHDLLSPKHKYINKYEHKYKNKYDHKYKNMQYKSKTFSLSIEENIEPFSMNLGFILTESPFINIHIGFDDKYKVQTNEISFEYDVNSYSCGLIDDNHNESMYNEYVNEFGVPQKTKYLISFAQERGKKISFSEARKLIKRKDIIPTPPIKHERKQSEKLKNLNHLLTNLTMSDEEGQNLQSPDSDSNESEPENDENENKNQQFYLIQNALSTVLDSDDEDSDRNTNNKMDKKQQIKEALSSILCSDDSEAEQSSDNGEECGASPESIGNGEEIPLHSGIIGMGLTMSQTLLSLTPEPQSDINSPQPPHANTINEDSEMIYRSTAHSHTNGNGHSNNDPQSRMDLLVNMLNDLDNENTNDIIQENGYYKSEKIDNYDYINKKLKKKRARQKNKNRSNSQPVDAIKNSLSVPTTPSTPPTPCTPKKPHKTNKNHQRSFSTDQSKRKPVKLEEWKAKYKKQKSNSNIFVASPKTKRTQTTPRPRKQRVRNKSTTKFKKQNKMDFNLYDVEIKAHRRYRLMDGRIGIAKFKGKTAFGKGTESYVGLLLEYGDGEHDGTVYNKTYFRCRFGKGIFVHPFQIIQDLGRFTGSAVTQEIIDDGYELVQEAKVKIAQYLKKHNIKKNKKMY